MIPFLLIAAGVSSSYASPARLAANPGDFKIVIHELGQGKQIGLRVSLEVTPALTGANAETIRRPIDGQVSCSEARALQDSSDSMSQGAIVLRLEPSTMIAGRKLIFPCKLMASGPTGSAVNAELRSWGPSGTSMGLAAVVLSKEADGSY